MAHLAAKDGYYALVDRLNHAPQGAPVTERLFQILALLFSEREAQLAAQLPMKPFTAKKAAQFWKVSEAEARAERVITPVNSLHRIVSMAIERGHFQDLLFDNRALFSHRAMAAVLGAVFKLPPIKQALTSQQIKSRYLAALAQRVRN